jgi:choline dehydrogenase-like flavoprotein
MSHDTKGFALVTGGLLRPRSRGCLRLTGASPSNPVDIDAELLSDPADLRALTACVRLCRAIGNSVALRPFTKREIMPRTCPGRSSSISRAMPSFRTGISRAPRKWDAIPCRSSMANCGSTESTTSGSQTHR